MLLEKFKDQAIRAYYGTSHSPEKRGASTIAEFSKELSEDLEIVKQNDGDAAAYQTKYERFFTAWLSAHSNCLSTMIAGPSKFPVRRAEKANRTKQNRYAEFRNFRVKALESIRKAKRRADAAETDPILELQSKIEKSKALQDQMKAANKIVRSGKLKAEKVAGIAALLNCSEDAAARLLEPDFCGRVGFADYQLTNNLARIKQMEQRLIVLQRKAQSETTETELQNGISVVENKELDRLQIFFPGKPEAHIISALKRSAFKWSPSNGCWQRQLTENARRDFREIKSLF